MSLIATSPRPSQASSVCGWSIPGNIVHAADTNGMIVITQIQPISVIFTVAEDQLPPILQKIRAGQKLTVEAWDRDLKNQTRLGHAFDTR